MPARVCIVARLSGISKITDECSTEQDEAHIVEQFTSFLMKRCAERRRELLFQVISVDAGVQLIAIDKVSSIGLYYWCTSLEGLQRLTDLYTSGRLQLMLNQVFSSLLDGSQSLLIDNLSWNRLEFFKCSQYMFESQGMSVFSEIYSLAQRKNYNDVSSIDFSFSISQLPRELTEIIVIRSSALLFTILKAGNPLADVYVVATLCAVSRSWWRMLTNRKYLKRLIKQYFRRLCHPFNCRPQQLESLQVEKKIVNGVAEFNNKLFAICNRVNHSPCVQQ
jgi:hypothetical protein